MAADMAGEVIELDGLWGPTELVPGRSTSVAASDVVDDVVEETIVPLVSSASKKVGRRYDHGDRPSDVRHWMDPTSAGGGLKPKPHVVDERSFRSRRLGVSIRQNDCDPVALDIRARLNSITQQQQPKSFTKWQLVRHHFLPWASRSSEPKMLDVWNQATTLSKAVAAIDDDNTGALIEALTILERQHQEQKKPSATRISGDGDRGYKPELPTAALLDSCSLLQHAIASGRPYAVHALLQFGGERLVLGTQMFDPLKMTAKTCLHDAALGGDVAIVDSILQHLSPNTRELWLRHETTFVDHQGSFGGDRLSVTALHLAALCGHVALVEYLVRDMNVPVDLPCRGTNTTPLHLAAMRVQQSAMRSLLALGARTDLVDNEHRTLLHFGILSGDKETMVTCLHASQRPACVDHWRQANPLLLAIYLGNADMLIALLDDPDMRRLVAVPSAHLGQTPLHAACSQEDASALPMCEALLVFGADSAAVNKQGETPLMTAAYRNSADTLVAMARHFDAPRQRYFAIANASGHSVWHYAMQPDRREALVALLEAALYAQRLERDTNERHFGESDDLVVSWDQGGSPDLGTFLALEVDGLVTTPLHLAVQWGAKGCLALLLKYISPFTADGNGDTFLHLAAKQGCESVLEEFVFDSSTANLLNFQGHSLLHAACKAGSWSCARVLLPLSDPWTASALGETVAHELCRRDDVDYGLLRDVLLSRRCSSDGAGGCLATGEEKLALRDAYGRTALHHLAARNLYGSADKYFRLFETTRGGGTHSPCNLTNNVGDTPLHDCLLAGRVDNLTSLLTVFGSDADVNVPNNSGLTPLHLAAKLGLVEAVKPLLSCGAKLGIFDADGNTVVHALIRQATEQPSRADSCREMLEVLLYHARDKNLPPLQHYSAATWPSETNGDRLRLVAVTLLCLTKNSDGVSAIFYAAQIVCIELLHFMLTIADTFKLHALSSYDAPKGYAFYDVTDLVPETVVYNEVDHFKEPSPPLFSYKRLCGHNCLKNIQPAWERNQITLDASGASAEQPHLESPPAPAASLVEVILLNTSTSSRFLELTPIKEMVAGYWSPYKIMYLILMAIHVVYMSFFSWVSLDAIADVKSVLNCSVPRTDVTQNVSNAHTPSGHQASLAVVMLWPLLIIAGDIVWLSNYLCTYGCRLAEAARKKLTDAIQSHVPMFWLVGIAFSWLSICFYVLHLIDHCTQDYVLCAALISGWIYTIHFTQGIRSVHHFSLALSKILMRDIWQFGLVCVSVLLGYSFGMHALTIAVPQQSATYSNYGSTLFKVFAWGAGMGDFYPETRQDYSNAGKSIDFIQSVFVTFIIALNIILLNVLIAVMNDSYAAVRERSDVAWRLSWLRKAISLEKQYPSIAKVVRRWRKKDIVTDPAWPGRYYMKIPLIAHDDDKRKENPPDMESVIERMSAFETAVNSLSSIVGELASKNSADCDISLADEDERATEDATRRFVRLRANCDCETTLSTAFVRPLSRRSHNHITAQDCA